MLHRMHGTLHWDVSHTAFTRISTVTYDERDNGRMMLSQKFGEQLLPVATVLRMFRI